MGKITNDLPDIKPFKWARTIIESLTIKLANHFINKKNKRLLDAKRGEAQHYR